MGFSRQYWSGLPFPSPVHACMHAKSLQSCPTLRDPIDGSPPGSTVPGSLQARVLEWGAIVFSIGLHRTIQLQLLQHYWLGHRLGLPWYWMVCLGNEQRSFCIFWDCIQVLHFRLFVDHDGYSISSKGFLPTVVDTMVIWVKFPIPVHSRNQGTKMDWNEWIQLRWPLYVLLWAGIP